MLRQITCLALLFPLILLEAGVANASSVDYRFGPGIAYLRVGSSSGSAYENYCAYTDPRTAYNLSSSYNAADSKPIIDAYPNDGCTKTNSSYKDSVVIFARGRCNYVDKSINAFEQGAVGLIVVSSESYESYLAAVSPKLPKTFQTMLVSKVAYQSFKSQFTSTPGARATLYRPNDDGNKSKQYMFLFLYAIALVTMVMSCVAAATALKELLLTRATLSSNSSYNSEHDPETASMSWWQTAIYILILIAIPVTILLLLNFAYDYFVWVMLVLYGYSVASSLVYYANRIYLSYVEAKRQTGPRPWLATTVEWNLGKCCGKISFTYFEFFAYPVGLAVAIFWFVYRNSHWAFILTNMLNVVLVMRVIESLVLALRIKLVTILLICFLVYDVFFVFITPLFSGSSPTPTDSSPTPTPTISRVKRDTVMDYYIERGGSIMERVALGTAGLSGEIIPIVFKVMPYPPLESISTCVLPYSILGLGDVILPAILIGLNLFFDLAWSNRCWPYFMSSMIGYIAGLGACAGVLFATGKGQPALLYIVPLILIASYLCSAIKHELKVYFNTALPDEYQVCNRLEIASDNNHEPEQSVDIRPFESGIAGEQADSNETHMKTPFASN